MSLNKVDLLFIAGCGLGLLVFVFTVLVVSDLLSARDYTEQETQMHQDYFLHKKAWCE